MKTAWQSMAALGLMLTLASAQTAQQPRATPAVEAEAPPDQQPTQEQMSKLFDVMRVGKLLQEELDTISAVKQRQVEAQVKELALKLTGGTPLTPAQLKDVEKVSNSYWQKAQYIYSPEPRINDMMVAYQHHLDRSDVQAMIAFFSSRAGQDLANAPVGISQALVPAVVQRLQGKPSPEEITQDREKLMKQGHLSDSDVKAIIGFYASAAGQHLLQEQPDINEEFAKMFAEQIEERNKVLAGERAKDKIYLARILTPGK